MGKYPELEREEFTELELFKGFALTPVQEPYFEQISRAIHSFGAIREWDPAARLNLIMSILGSISYVGLNPVEQEADQLSTG